MLSISNVPAAVAAHPLDIIEHVIRPESKQAIDELHRNNIEVIMITGDARAVAEAVGAELGVNQVLAEVLPADKASKIEALPEPTSPSMPEMWYS